MKRSLVILLCLLGVLPASAIIIQISWGDFTTQLIAYRRTVMFPDGVNTNGNQVTTLDTNTATTDANGQVNFTNVVPNGFTAIFYGPNAQTRIHFTITNGTPTNQTINANTILSVPLVNPGASNAYSILTSDERYLQPSYVIASNNITVTQGTSNGYPSVIISSTGGGGSFPGDATQFGTNAGLVQITNGAKATNLNLLGATTTHSLTIDGIVHGPTNVATETIVSNIVASNAWNGTFGSNFNVTATTNVTLSNTVAAGAGLPSFGVDGRVTGTNAIKTAMVSDLNTNLFIQASSNLSDVANVATARANLGINTNLFLNTASNFTDVASTNAAITNLGVVPNLSALQYGAIVPGFNSAIKTGIIISPSPTNNLDYRDPWLLYNPDNSTVYCYYNRFTNANGGATQIHVSTSTDSGVTWTYRGLALGSNSSAGSFYHWTVAEPTVLYEHASANFGGSNVYFMGFAANGTNDNPPLAPGIAVSTDGISFSVPTNSPVFNPTQTWQGGRAGGLSLGKQNGTYFSLYSSGANPPWVIGRAMAPSPLGPWTDYTNGPVLIANGIQHGVEEPRVLKIREDLFYVFFDGLTVTFENYNAGGGFYYCTNILSATTNDFHFQPMQLGGAFSAMDTSGFAGNHGCLLPDGLDP